MNRGFWLMLLLSASLSAFATPHVARADDSTTEDDDEDSDDASDGPAKKPEPPPPPPPVMPAKIDICMTSAVIAPTKADGSPWDAGGSKLPADEQKFVAKAFFKLIRLSRLTPAAVGGELTMIFARPTLLALAKPDVFGSIQLAPSGEYTTNPKLKLPIASAKKPVREFSPAFSDTVCFKGVDWRSELRLRVNLIDKDLINDDRIAMVEVVANDVRDAFAHRKARHIYVGDQDTHQLKFVVLNVTKAAADEDDE